MNLGTVSIAATIEPTPVSATYRIGLGIVVIAMLVLPLLYLALIGLTAAAVWWHVTSNTWLLGGSGGQIRLLVYATPAVAGVVLVFFMVKPILARPAKRHERLALAADEQPALFALIDEICRQVRAPRPSRVYVDCTPNASAAFAGGPLRLADRNLVLTIGLPLAAALSMREFAGVLAHEFGHFAQGGGMRLTVIVRGVNAWFARVVYERDEWDESLERRSRRGDVRLAAVFAAARAAVWVSRKALFGLMVAGHAISCFMLRHMEFDADSYEIKIAGSDAFVRTSQRLRELGMAAPFVYGDLHTSLQKGTIPGNLPVYMVERSRGIAQSLAQTDAEAKTGWFDTHPSDADRIRAAHAAGAPGVLVNADDPATLLFRDFAALSAAATKHHFEHDLGLTTDSLTLVDTHAALQESRTRAETFHALTRFFGECWSPLRRLRFENIVCGHLESNVCRATLAAARDAMTSAAAHTAPRYSEFDALERKRLNAVAARALLAAGFSAVKPEDFDLPVGTAAAAQDAERTALDQQSALDVQLQVFEAHVARRLGCALALAAEGNTGALSKSELHAMTEAANAIGRAMPDVRELWHLDFATTLIENNAASSPKPEETTALLRQMHRRVVAVRERITSSLMTVECPADLATSAMTLAERCGLRSSGEQMPVSEVVDRAFRLHSEIVGRLTFAALQQEDRLEQ